MKTLYIYIDLTIYIYITLIYIYKYFFDLYIYIFINYIDIYIYYIDIYIYIYILIYTCIFEKMHFLFFQGKLFFHPRCIYFWLRAISQQLHVCQKCVHIYVFETVFLPDQTAFFADQKAFFPDHVSFFRWNALTSPLPNTMGSLAKQLL